MAKYSVQLWEVVQSGTNIFDFDYPIYDENHRDELEQMIIDHYYFREIGFETVGRFNHYLKCRMREIMPIYNNMYKVIDENNITILSTMKSSYTNANDTKFTAGTTQAARIENKMLKADTPQGTTDITTGENVSSIDKGNELNTVVNSGVNETESENNGSTTGYSGITEAELLEKYKEHMLNIDVLIIDDLNELFMTIY